MPEAPRREDIPDHVDGGDILFELRLFEYEFTKWRMVTNGDLGWLRKQRAIVADVVRVAILGIPILATLMLVWMTQD